MGKKPLGISALPLSLSEMVQVSSPSRKQQRNPLDRSCFQQYSKLCALILVIIAFVVLDSPNVAKGTLRYGKNTESIAKTVIPTHEVIDGIDVLWAAPDEIRPPCGILFVAHGCNHAHTDWFVECQQGCLGLPEELAIVNLALERNLVVVAVSSKDRFSKCWNPSLDGPRVAAVLQTISKKYKSSPLPIWAFGASSGGGFVSALGNFMELDGYLSQIMARSPEEVRTKGCMVYLTMEHDHRTRSRAEQIVSEAPNHIARHIPLPPLPISSPEFFANRIPDITSADSRSMVKSLKEGEFLDDQGYLRQDPRQSNWRSAIQHLTVTDSLVADQSAISEVMNAAYSMHEMSREGVAEGLDFCISLLQPPSSTCR